MVQVKIKAAGEATITLSSRQFLKATIDSIEDVAEDLLSYGSDDLPGSIRCMAALIIDEVEKWSNDDGEFVSKNTLLSMAEAIRLLTLVIEHNGKKV